MTRDVTLQTLTSIVNVDGSSVPTTIKPANLGTGTLSATTFLNGLGQFVSVPGNVSSVTASGAVGGLTLTSGATTGAATITLGGAIANLDASVLTTGTIGIGRLGTNTPAANTFLSGNNTWTSAVTSPATGNLQFQYNLNGSFAAAPGLTYNTTTNTVQAVNGPQSDNDLVRRTDLALAAAGIKPVAPAGTVVHIAESNITGTYTHTTGAGADTFTGTSILNFDTTTIAVGSWVVLVEQTTALQNGSYVVTANSAAGFVLTRTADEPAFGGLYIATVVSANNYGVQYQNTTTGTIVVGVSNIMFALFGVANSATSNLTQVLTNNGTANNLNLTLTGTGLLESTAGLQLNGATTGSVTLKPPATSTSYGVTLPASQGGANTYLRNDGAGLLTWNTIALPVFNQVASFETGYGYRAGSLTTTGFTVYKYDGTTPAATNDFRIGNGIAVDSAGWTFAAGTILITAIGNPFIPSGGTVATDIAISCSNITGATITPGQGVRQIPAVESFNFPFVNTNAAGTSLRLGSGLSLDANGGLTATISSVPTWDQVTTAGARSSLNVFIGPATGNSVAIGGSATGANPLIAPTGAVDTNITLAINGLGTGSINLASQNTNYIQISGSATNATPAIRVLGGDMDVGLNFFNKGNDPFVFTNLTNGSATRINSDGAGSFINSQLNAIPTANFDLSLRPQAAGKVNLADNQNNYITVTGAISTANPVIAATGSGTNVGIDFVAKGVGAYNFKSNNNINAFCSLESSTTQAIFAAQSTTQLNVDLVLTTQGTGNLYPIGINIPGATANQVQILVADAQGSTTLGAGTTGQVLTSNGTAGTVYWATPNVNSNSNLCTGTAASSAYTSGTSLLVNWTVTNNLSTILSYASGVFTNISSSTQKFFFDYQATCSLPTGVPVEVSAFFTQGGATPTTARAGQASVAGTTSGLSYLLNARRLFTLAPNDTVRCYFYSNGATGTFGSSIFTVANTTIQITPVL